MNEVTFEDFPKTQKEFDERFSSEQACYEYLFRIRWPQGFRCPRCGNPGHWVSARGLCICRRCEHHQSITAGTILHGTKKPLRDWFKALWWFTTRKSGVNAINLKDLLGLGSYQTAWRWLQKLRSCTIRQGRQRLSGHVEVDEFYLGGQCSGKPGRGAGHKCAVAIAVERKGRKLGRLRLQPIDSCGIRDLTAFVQAHIAPGSHIQTDGWSGYAELRTTGYTHEPVFMTRAANKHSVLPGAHLVISLIKRLILGTFQGRFEQKYLGRYLDEYVFRFNRRTTQSVGKRFWRIVQQLAASEPITNAQLVAKAIRPALAN
jgi:hypothetical protein